MDQQIAPPHLYPVIVTNDDEQQKQSHHIWDTVALLLPFSSDDGAVQGAKLPSGVCAETSSHPNVRRSQL